MDSPSMQKWPAHRNLFATPKATDAERGGRGDLIQQVRGNESPSGHFKTWPTPHGFPKDGQARNPGPSGNELGRAVNEAERWPTPRARDWKGPGYGDDLPAAARRFPTPKASDAQHSGRDSPSKLGQMTTLPQAAGSGSLNPTWVEWLMGFPLGWTDCER